LSDPRRLNLTVSQVQSNIGLACLSDLSKHGADMCARSKAPGLLAPSQESVDMVVSKV
jgi:hypothetical protein